ncbi:hypothetical protein CD351_08180 [Erythrobacter sp. KY5]|uniref:GntR family transcriptional regulator n=1 Tax=Erythrobacter sp. KY5 TaxID=2011159 RepID=UPI000DBF133B|nr:GntR family transcriptional regulator [Erythrobacter sp. KY5]AWW74401.1 hypothetical protein CD351_08180 [Erythrobacter sp. KY5]
MKNERMVAGQALSNKTPRTADRVVQILREQILNGYLSPGQRLVETDLIGEFNVSRNTLREALSRLQSDGLVEIIHQRGASVVRLTRETIEETFGIRERLEGYAAELAAEYSHLPENVIWLKEQKRTWMSAHVLEDGDRHMSVNVPFHEGLIAMCGQRRLVAMINSLQLPAFRARGARHFDEKHRLVSAQDHLKIIEALLKSDAKAAGRAAEDHIRRAKRIALTVFEQEQQNRGFN